MPDSQIIKSLDCSLVCGKLEWRVNGIALQDEDLRKFRILVVKWPNGNRLRHRVSSVTHIDSLVSTSREAYSVCSLDLFMDLKFHGQKVSISLYRNPDIRKLVEKIKWLIPRKS